jgi:hypothetical protein
MAETTSEKIAKLEQQKEWYRTRIRIANQDLTVGKDKKATQDYIDDLEDFIANADRQIAELKRPAKEKKEAEKKAKAEAAGESTLTNPPEWLDIKLQNDLKNSGIPLTDAIFLQGGVGTTAFVYNGEKVSPVGRTTKTGGYQTGSAMKTEVVSNVSLANDVVQSYWNDKSIQDKVLSAMRSAGKTNANLLDGFSQWQGVVQTAASVYQGGKGPKMTPMDILNMTIKNSGGPQVSKDVQQYDRGVLAALIENVYMSSATRKPTAEEVAARLEELDKIIQKGVTTTTTGTTTTRTPSVTMTGLEEAVKKKVNTTAKESVETTKSLKFQDWVTQQMRAGI